MINVWKQETINSLNDLGGIAHLNDIFNRIIERGIVNFSNSKTPKRTLSRVLQTYSYSTDYGIDNTFYSVYGVKAHKGIWGLVDKQINNMRISLSSDDDEFMEGKEIMRQHIMRERNKTLVKKAKDIFKQNHNGKLYCEVCGFDFSEVYGDIGNDFIEAHHVMPISQIKQNKATEVKDLIMLCSNCHSMIHRGNPYLTKEQLISIYNNHKM